MYEPVVEIKDRHTRTMFVEVPEKIETGEAERIAVDWTARGGEGSSNCKLAIQFKAQNLMSESSDFPLSH